MTQEEKHLLLADLCARLPYDLKLRYVEDLVVKKESHIVTLNTIYLEHILNGDADIKPYLRPMSSMTMEESKYKLSNFFKVIQTNVAGIGYMPTLNAISAVQYIDWLISHHFDYRGLIEMGLALEAPDGLY